MPNAIAVAHTGAVSAVRRLAARGDDFDVPLPAARLDESLALVTANRAWQAAIADSRLPVSVKSRWDALVSVADVERVAARLRRVLERGDAATVEARGVVCDWVEIRAAPYGSNGSTGLVVMMLDISSQKQREASLAYSATHDPLTGVLNRVAMVERVREALNRMQRGAGTVAVLFVDLDNFKEVNDVHGHVFGDGVLTALAARLQHAVRPTDALGRMGGDEFVVVCEAMASPVEASLVARRVAYAVKEPSAGHPAQHDEIGLSASVGIAFATSPDQDATELIGQADRAMYTAKERGEPVYVAGTPQHDEAPPVISRISSNGSAGRSLGDAIDMLIGRNAPSHITLASLPPATEARTPAPA